MIVLGSVGYLKGIKELTLLLQCVRGMGVMVEIKEMSCEKKYISVLDGMKFVESYVVPFVKENLGDEKVTELKDIWQKELNPIPIDAPCEEAYEIDYFNWLRNWESAYNLVSNQLGVSGTGKLVEAAVEANKPKNGGPALFMLKLIKAISPETAFRTFAKQMAYQLQVLSPCPVSGFTGHKMVLEIPHCKCLDVQGCDEFCTVGCQKVYPLFLESQFKIKMTTNRKGIGCTVTLSPIS
jgi:hypothetical protein